MLYNRNTNEQGNALVFLVIATLIILLGFCYFMGITPAEFIEGLK